MRRALLLLLCLASTSTTVNGQIRLRARKAVTPTPPVELRILTESLPDGAEDVAYTCPAITATGGNDPYTWSTSGTLPTGITIDDTDPDDDTAICAGTPTDDDGGTFNFTLIVTDDDGTVATKAVQIVVAAAASALPTGWESGDLGQQGATPGTATYVDNGDAGLTTDDVITLTSSAPNIPTTGATTTDSFRYACTTITDDGTLTAEVSAITGYTFAQAGVMLRESLTDSAAHLFPFVMPTGNGFSNQRKYRLTTAGATTNSATGLSSHFWIRAERVGNIFTGYVSTDGTTWVQASDSVTITMASTVYACLAVTNIETSSEVSADFENITVDDDPEAPPPSEQDAGGYRPHYTGFGATTVGGRGDATKVICLVTSRLGTTGAPTLVSTADAHADPAVVHYHGTANQCLAGINSSYALPVIGGYAEMGAITITNPNVTFAGQTAPDPLILRNGAIIIDAPEIVLQHIDVRGGDPCGPGDAIMLRGANTPVFNVVFDHIAVGWCGHGSLSISALPNPAGSGPNTTKAQDILLIDSMVGPGFSNGGPTGGSGSVHSICHTITGNNAANITHTMLRNLFVNCGNRGPWLASGMRADVINNLNYNAHCEAGDDGTYGFAQVIGVPVFTDELIEIAYVGNVNLTGPSSTNCNGTVGFWVDSGQITAGVRVHLWDNSGPGCGALQTDVGQASCAWYTAQVSNAGTAGNTLVNRATFLAGFSWFHGFNYPILANAEVQAAVLEEAGPFPMDRDAITTALVAHVNNGTGATINIQNVAALGGWPAIADTTGSYTIPQDPHGAGDCGTTSAGVARTKLECDLEDKARALEPRFQP